MAKIYLINVGANTGQSREARSPIFLDGTWIYVPFPNSSVGQVFPRETWPYVRVGRGIKGHLDPDWKGLTYGDNCGNRRARALLSVTPGDVLLFWALLWRTPRQGADIWQSHERGWFLIGALRVQHVLPSRAPLRLLPKTARRRAKANAHVTAARVEGRCYARLFVGDPRYSRRFEKAVDLEVGDDAGLLRQVVRAKDGRLVQWNGAPRWNSVTRPCRAILDLNNSRDKAVARRLAARISKGNRGLNLLADIDLKAGSE